MWSTVLLFQDLWLKIEGFFFFPLCSIIYFLETLWNIPGQAHFSEEGRGAAVLLRTGTCCLCACLFQWVGSIPQVEKLECRYQFGQGLRPCPLILGTGCLFRDVLRSLYKLQSSLSTDLP